MIQKASSPTDLKNTIFIYKWNDYEKSEWNWRNDIFSFEEDSVRIIENSDYTNKKGDVPKWVRRFYDSYRLL